MRLGYAYVLSVPYVAGLACFGGPMIGGFRLTGWVFAIMLAAAPFVYFTDRTPSRFPLRIWMPWLFIVVCSLMWTADLDLSAAQDVCQIITPFVVAPIAAKAIKTTRDLDLLLRGFFHCLLILLAGLALNFATGVSIVPRTTAMTAALVGCVFVAQFVSRRAMALTSWCGCLLVTGITGSRTATVALLLQWLILPDYRRQINRVLFAVLIAAVALALFYSPVFQERFFLDDRGSLSDLTQGRFSSAGRFEVWSELWKRVGDRPLLGAGAHGSASIVLEVWGNMDKPHNDYLRILLEQGVVGLSFFLFGVVCQFVSLWIRRGAGNEKISIVRSSALLGMVVFVLIAVTDNPIVYGPWFMHPLFVLVGVSYSDIRGA